MDTSRDMVMMKGGKMIMVIDGEMLLMEEDLITAGEILVKTDGTIILPDGTISVLREDEAMVIDLVLTRMMEA